MYYSYYYQTIYYQTTFVRDCGCWGGCPTKRPYAIGDIMMLDGPPGSQPTSHIGQLSSQARFRNPYQRRCCRFRNSTPIVGTFCALRRRPHL
eukprot:6502042-Prymnesium_polylepis.1